MKNQPASAQGLGQILFTLIVLCSLAGYGWYLLRYQNHGQGGDLIKASHMLQIFPFLGLLAGGMLEKLVEAATDDLDRRDDRLGPYFHP